MCTEAKDGDWNGDGDLTETERRSIKLGQYSDRGRRYSGRGGRDLLEEIEWYS